jgi:hypothetical protein
MDRYKSELREIYERINRLIESMNQPDADPKLSDSSVQSNKWLTDGRFISFSKHLVEYFLYKRSVQITARDKASLFGVCYKESPPGDPSLKVAFDSIVKEYGGKYVFSIFEKDGMYEKLVTEYEKLVQGS